LGSMLPRFLNFLLVRLHTDVFPPEDYGVITKLLAYVAVLNVVYMFGMETAYFRFATKPGADERKIFNLTQTVVITISVVFSVVLILFMHPIALAMDVGTHQNIILWLVAVMFIDALVAIPFARLRLQKKAVRFATGKIINILIVVVLNIYFLTMSFNPAVGIDYIIISTVLANSFYLIFFFQTLISWRPTYSAALTPAIATYAYPVMLTGLAGMTNEMFSRQTLDWWLPEDFYPGQSAAYALGVFGACYKFAMLMNLAVQAFRFAAEPFFFSNAVDKESPPLFARVNHYFVIVCCVLLLGVSINIDLVKYLLGSELYWEGLHIVPILLLGYLFLGIYYNMSIWFKITDRTYFGTIITIGGAIITIAANYLLIPHLGYLGSSYATLICYSSMTIACYLIGQRYFPIPYEIGKSILYISITMGLVYAVNAIPVATELMSHGFHLMVLALYILAVYLVEKKGFEQASN
jgi:O-antigen/teichoic acid export membrane protein